jgi:hypothetical protein
MHAAHLDLLADRWSSLRAWPRSAVAVLLILASSCLLLAVPVAARATVTYNGSVKAIMDLVARGELEPAVKDLSGAQACTIGGSSYTFTTRRYNSGTPIDKAEQYVYEKLGGYGLDSVSYFTYTGGGGGRDVIGQINGSSPSRSNQIVIVAAHIDDYPWSGSAPGADDNASGVSAMLFVARKFAAKEFECTIRFVATGDEENLGSGASEYAAWCKSQGQNVIGVIVPDMLAYDNGTHTIELWIRPTVNDPGGGDAALAQVYSDVISAYSLTGIAPVTIQDTLSYTDADSFWANSIHAVDLSEGWTPTSPFYHTSGDTAATLSWTYYLDCTKALVGQVAHYAGIDTTVPTTPTVSSSSHPVQTAWYATATASLSWSASDTQTGVSSYSYAIDQTATTTPDTTGEGSGTTYTSGTLPQGTSYFHVRARDGAGNWGAAQHFTLKVDTVAPATTDNADGLHHHSFALVLTPSDASSGVASTAYRIDGGAWKSGTSVMMCIAIRHKRGGYTRGSHTIEYRSTDNLGNVEAIKSCSVYLGV